MQFSVTIPQLFYDLIARMVPGSLFLIMLSYEMSGTGVYTSSVNTFSSDLLSVTLYVLVGGIMSYLMGWVLQSFSFLSAEQSIKKEYDSLLDSQKVTLEIREIYDLIRIKNEAAGFRILKRRAEARMLESSRVGMFYVSWISLGLILLNVLKQLPSFDISTLEWIIRVLIPIVLTLGFWKQEQRAWRGYYHNVINHYKILSTTNKRKTSK